MGIQAGEMGQIKMGSRKLQECPGHRRKMAQLEPDRLPEEKQTNENKQKTGKAFGTPEMSLEI